MDRWIDGHRERMEVVEMERMRKEVERERESCGEIGRCNFSHILNLTTFFFFLRLVRYDKYSIKDGIKWMEWICPIDTSFV
jgi:hypothetical protein